MIASQDIYYSYIGNGVTDQFEYKCRIFDVTDLRVTVAGSIKTLGTHYTVSGVDVSSGGSVTFAPGSIPASGVLVELERILDYERGTDYTKSDDFRPITVDKDQDYQTALMQQINGNFFNFLRLPEGMKNTQLPTVTPSGLFAWDQSGNGIEYLLTAPPYVSTAVSASSYGSDLADSVDAIGSANVTLVIDSPITVNADVSVPGNISIVRQHPGVLIVALGVAVTFAPGCTDEVDAALFGMTGSGNETYAFHCACVAASAGCKIVKITFPTLTVTEGVSAEGCLVRGCQTVLTGTIIDHRGLVDVVVYDQNQSDFVTSPSIRMDDCPKLLYRYSSTVDYVFVQKRTTGYAMMGFDSATTTTGESLATTATDPTRRRLTFAGDAVYVALYQHTPSATNGAWTEPTAAPSFANIIPPFDSGRAIKYWYTPSGVAGSYLEFTTYPKNGQINVAFFCGAASDPAVTVRVKGIDYTVDCVGDLPNEIKIVTFPCVASDTDPTVIRITRSATGSLYVIGLNFVELKDWSGQYHDEFLYYRNSAFASYLTQKSANDCVIREYYTGTYGLSYHGGETSITSTYYGEDNAAITLTTGQYAVRRNLHFKTSCSVDWPEPGGSVTVTAHHYFARGGISSATQITGPIVVSELYTHMFGATESFNLLTGPTIIDLDAAANGSFNTLGRTDRVIMENTTTRQRYIGEFSLWSRDQCKYGGVWVWKVVGSYRKLYSALAKRGKLAVESLGFVSNHIFD